MRRRVAIIASVVTLLACASFAYGQDATLRYRWIKGDEVRYRVGQQTTTTMNGLPGAGELTVTQDIVQILRLSVDDAGPESATLRITFESVRMEANSPMGNTLFDSTKDKPSDPIGMMMASMIGESITMVTAPTGRVTRVDGMSRIVDNMAKTMPGGTAGSAQLVGQLKAMMSDDAVSNMFSQGFVQFPDRPVKAGDSWTNQFSITIPVVGALSSTSTQTVKAIEQSGAASVARIGTLIVMKQDAKAAAARLPGVSTKLGDTKGEGEVVFDITKGRIQRASQKTGMVMSLSMTAPDGTPVNFENVVTTTLTIEIVEK